MEYLLEAPYLIFWLPASAAMLLMLLMGLTGIGFEGPGIDHDVDHDLDQDVGHDGHADHIDHGDGILVRAFSVLGLGRVPLSIVLVTFSMIWGFVGIVSNQILEFVHIPGGVYIWISATLAFCSAVGFTNMLSRVIARFMPKTETYGADSAYFIGKRGAVQFTVTETSGTVKVSDVGLNPITVQARIKEGADQIGSGEQVLIMSHHGSGVYMVIPHSLVPSRS